MPNLQECDLAGLPPWLATMRRVAAGLVTEKDVAEIVRKQVELAKQGNKDAIKFVFEQALGGQMLKGATFIQNNYGRGAERPDRPTKALPGSPKKLRSMAARASAGLPLHDPKDGPEVDLS